MTAGDDVIVRAVERLEPKPGDVLFVTLGGDPDAASVSALAGFLEANLPDLKVVFLREGSEVRLVRLSMDPFPLGVIEVD